MNVLVLGSGGREHTLAWKIAQSKKLNNLFIAPGNAGTSCLGKNVNIPVTDFEGIKRLIIDEKINIVVVGPEDPLVKGITDYLKNSTGFNDLIVVGPSRQGAMLEGSKEFAKEFMLKYKLPTAGYKRFT